MEKLKLRPDSSSYSVDHANENTSVTLDGGASRVRRTMVASTHKVSVSFTLNVKSFNYLMAFYRTSTAKGSLKFIMELIIDGGIDDYVCTFVPDSLKLTSQAGLKYTVSFKVEAECKQFDAKADELIVKNFTL